MPLPSIIKRPPVLSLVPASGVQVIDLGFAGGRASGIDLSWAFYDRAGESGPPIRVEREDDNASVSYEVDLRKLLETFGNVWMPLPMLREEQGGDFYHGPTNWARVYLSKLDEPDENGFDHRVLIAFDTALLPQREGEAYLAPSDNDAQRGAVFSLCHSEQALNWFVQEQWVADWCREAVRDMVTAEEAKRRRNAGPATDEQVAERLEGPKEAIARYKALVYLLTDLDLTPKVRMIDRVTDPRPTPIDVDLVLDVGNSRTCGMLIETHPDETGTDITQAVKLQLRDLSRPVQVYTDPFESRIEFNRAAFGKDDISLTSGRPTAFAWPTVARIGPEAQRLAGQRRGSEGATGMSSPKRYLWDEDPRQDGWRFNTPARHGQHAPSATGVYFTTLVNDAGEPLHKVPDHVPEHDERRFPSFRAVYARSNLMSFALTEIFLQTLVMMNSAAHRLRRRNADLPRRLRRVIMTMPTALPLAERQILRRQAESARDLVYLCLNQAKVTKDPETGAPVLQPAPGVELPEIRIDWDEASATQAVFLYSQIAQAYSGDARGFFRRSRLPVNRSDEGLGDDFRLATLDMGGGTTDLVVTSFRVEGRGANVTLFPKQIFREGMSLAGDDIAYQIIREHVLPPVIEALEASKLGDRAEFLAQQLFGGDRGDMDIEEQLLRQQFAVHVALPVALTLIGEYETWDRTGDSIEPLKIGDILANRGGGLGIIEQINESARRQGAEGFDLAEVVIPVDPRAMDLTVRGVATEMLQAFAEIVYRARADLLILSGRPSRMPAVADILAESMAVPPHRVVPLHSFRAGSWYPFRDYAATISDPKTTAAVGAMLCLLGEGRLKNFNFRSDHLTTKSTARYFGKLDRDNRLRDEDVYYRDLDLENEDYELPEEPFEFRGPMTLGFRQFGADWWPGSRLYNLDYASPDIAQRLNPRTPLSVTLRRNTRGENKEIVDAFVIDRIEDVEGRAVGSNQLRLRLQTIENQDGYWLDTGILLNS
ncbi:MAG: virulence factor SrfB [Minwuia sp.]|uniref:virulence factor SrfB n=1 Tax=Minwuia sp. TaxID=2493630 RepID=UPI003A8A7BB1